MTTQIEKKPFDRKEGAGGWQESKAGVECTSEKGMHILMRSDCGAGSTHLENVISGEGRSREKGTDNPSEGPMGVELPHMSLSTNWKKGRSRKGSNLTTCAETACASTQNTLNPLRGRRTLSGGGMLEESQAIAGEGTNSPRATQGTTETVDGSVERVTESAPEKGITVASGKPKEKWTRERRRQHCQQIGTLGGQKTVQTYGRKYMSEIGKIGFQQFAEKHHDGNRAAARGALAQMKRPTPQPGPFHPVQVAARQARGE